MKRILALLLCIAMLLVIGCQKQDAEPPPFQAPQVTPEGEWGEFTTEDGYVQNTLITAVMNTEELIAPVTELSYSLCDNSSFGVRATHYTMGNDLRTHRLEICQNGAWIQAPTSGTHMTEMWMGYNSDPDPAAHRKHDLTMKMRYAKDKKDAAIQYTPLEKGEYRLIVTYQLNIDKPGINIPEGEHAAILYFTVT